MICESKQNQGTVDAIQLEIADRTIGPKLQRANEVTSYVPRLGFLGRLIGLSFLDLVP